MKRQKIGKYLLYAFGEILLIIIGILIAVNINQRIQDSKDREFRCIYLNELQEMFEHDIADVESNIRGFKTWNPHIEELYRSLGSDKLFEIDSIYSKFGIVGNYISFGQRSKTKVEELKFSTINLIKNRDLKNRILLYQDQEISFIRVLEGKYENIGEDIRKYYSQYFNGYNYQPAYPLDIKKVNGDNTYKQLVFQRLKMNYTLQEQYEKLNKNQLEIKDLLKEEIGSNCKE